MCGYVRHDSIVFGNKEAEAPKIGKGIVWIKTEAQCSHNCMIGQTRT